MELEATKLCEGSAVNIENRLRNKLSKRNIARSEMLFTMQKEKYRLNSFPDGLEKENDIRTDDTSLSPAETAAIIRDHFEL